MSGDAWTFLGIVVVQGAGVLTLWLKLRKTGKRADKAATAAEEAAVMARPTGNGWAEKVDKKLDHLIRITAETRQIAVQANDTISDHVNAHVAAQLNIPVRRVK